MVTSLVVFENGQLKHEPIEITYRTVTYYFDDNVAKAVEEPAKPADEPIREIRVQNVPEPATEIHDVQVLRVESVPSSTSSLHDAGEPPPMLERVVKVESAFSARKNKDEESVEPAPVQPEPKSEFKPEAKPVRVSLQPAPVSSAQKLANDLYLSGRGQFEAGDMRGAVESYLASIKLEPASAEVFLNLGHAYLKLEKYREAIKAFKESAKLNPAAAETFYGLGFASFRTNKFPDAVDAFKKATMLNPKMAKAHYGLALAYQELSDTNGLMAEYRILERLDPSLARKLAQTFPKFSFPCRQGGPCQ